ncbi:hypothetical protein L1987_82582 [Smallanthus sonchifolius]|uniref:Uncharacterized protein n=1 Tax=Smallanthus sonchifolius TaxID=185202 RepID=A0ACB8YEY5_9ASTR|nr:hypothetical protein L1987_82582 [Smallanthus sonchifolius]
MKDEGADLAPFDPSKKKKKKKVVIHDPADVSVEQLSVKTESLSVFEGLEPTLNGLKKKKKKQVKTESLDEEDDNNGENLDRKAFRTIQTLAVVTSADTYRRHFFEVFFDIAFLANCRPIMKEKGLFKKKTSFHGKGTDRDDDYEENAQVARPCYDLLAGGIWLQESRHNSSKRNRLFFLRCEKCGSGRSVAQIKTGLWLLLDVERPGHNCCFDILFEVFMLRHFLTSFGIWKSTSLTFFSVDQIQHPATILNFFFAYNETVQ